MQVTLWNHNRRIKRPLKTDHYWYDPDQKKMNHYRGTRMSFEYDPRTRKTIPKVITEDIPMYRNSWEDINDWLQSKKYRFEVLSKRPGNSVVIDIDDYEWHRAEKELRDLSIRFEVND